MAYQPQRGGATVRGPANAARVVGDWTLWERGRPAPLAGGEVFVALPDDALVEYAFETADGERLADPDNDEATNPFRPEARALRMPGAPGEPVGAGARLRGEVVPLAVATPALGGRRRATLYSPPDAGSRELPLIVAFDGFAYQRVGRLAHQLEALALTGAIAPARIVFLQPEDRTGEYSFNEAFAETVAGPVRGAVAERAPWPEAARTIAWGASLGGTTAVWLAAARPDLFRRCTSQSGLLGAADLPSDLNAALGDPSARCFQEGYAAPTYLECGVYEEFIAGNRRAATHLRERGVPHVYRERHAGHSWLGWRQGIGPGLRFHLAAV